MQEAGGTKDQLNVDFRAVILRAVHMTAVVWIGVRGGGEGGRAER